MSNTRHTQNMSTQNGSWTKRSNNNTKNTQRNCKIFLCFWNANECVLLLWSLNPANLEENRNEKSIYGKIQWSDIPLIWS